MPDALVYNRTSSSRYNSADINRVESWIQYLASALTASGNPVEVSASKNWTSTSIPRQSDFERIRRDIYALRDCFYSRMPEWRDFDIKATTTGLYEWNAWEWDLHLIESHLSGMIDNMDMFRHAETEPRWMESGGLFNK